MKLLSLNVWGGRVFTPLLDFIEARRDDIDIFCFQEVCSTMPDYITGERERNHLFDAIEKVLPRYKSLFTVAAEHPGEKDPMDQPITYGLATFYRSSLPVIARGDCFKSHPPLMTESGLVTACPKNVQYVSLWVGDKELTVANFHGVWSDDGKGDNPLRLGQSLMVKDFLTHVMGETILCGDFNMTPDSHSLGLLEEGKHNLIKDYGIASTRSHYYAGPTPFADYTVVSPGVQIKSFEVLNEPVSDHLAMIVEFDF